MMAELDEIAARLEAASPPPAGTLRVFGDLFGRPYDNVHTLVAVDVRDGALVLGFGEGEELTVFNPANLVTGGDMFRIERADRVRWEWYAHGETKSLSNRHREEHWLEDGVVRAESTATWYEPTFSPSLDHPAVELR